MRNHAPLGLVVTEDTHSAEIVTSVLQNMGYQVKITTEAAPDKAILYVATCALVVLDCDLPGVSVLEWRKHIQPIQAPILCIATDDSNLERFSSEGTDDFLLKPLGERVLRYRVGVVNRMYDYYVTLYPPHLTDSVLVSALPTDVERELLSVLYQTSQSLSNTLNVSVVLDQIMRSIRRLIPSEFLAVMMLEDGIGRFARIRGYETFVPADMMYNIRFPIREMYTFSTMIHTQQPLIISDVANDPRWVSYSEFAFERSYIGAPIIVDDEVVGFLNVSHRQPNLYNDQHVQLLEILASQAGVALNNARLYETVMRHSLELEQRLRDLMLVYETGQALQATLDDEEIVLALFRAVDSDILPLAEMQVVIYEADNQIFEEVYSVRQDMKQVSRMDMSADNAIPQDDVLHEVVTYQMAYRHEQWIYEPLISRNRVIGVWRIQAPVDETVDEMRQALIATLAARAASALDNARLYQQIASHAETLELRVYERTAKLNAALMKERELVEMKSRFVKNVSHEFRTRLALIQSSNQMLERYGERMSETERTARYTTISDTVKDMAQLLQDALTINEWQEEDDVHYRPMAVDLRQVTQTILTDFIVEYGKDYRMTYRLEDDCGQSILDINLWRRIIFELLHNAVKYSHTGGHIRISLECDLHFINFKVMDSGIGIPPDDQPHVFEMFHRGMNASNIVGSGLGLTIIQRAVEIHRGTIHIESEEGIGTTVTVTIPRYATEVN